MAEEGVLFAFCKRGIRMEWWQTAAGVEMAWAVRIEWLQTRGATR